MIAAVCWLLCIHVLFFARTRAGVWVPLLFAQLLCTGLDSLVSMHIVMYKHCCYACMLIKLVRSLHRRPSNNNTHPREEEERHPL